MIYTYENLFVAYFSINGRFCLVSLKNPTFSNIFPRAKHVLMTFEFWTLCACLSIFSLYISHLLLSSQQSPIYIVELFYIQVLTMVIITETLTSTSHLDIFTYLDYIFSCYLHTVGFYPYLLSYIYIRKKVVIIKLMFCSKIISIIMTIYVHIYVCVCVWERERERESERQR